MALPPFLQRPRQWVTSLFVLLFAGLVLANWDSFLAENKFNELWRTVIAVPQSGGSAARDYPRDLFVSTTIKFAIGPHGTGFVFAALIFGLWDLWVALFRRKHRSLGRANDVAAAKRAVRLIKVHTLGREEQSTVWTALQRLRDIKPRFHKSKDMQFVLIALESIVQKAYADPTYMARDQLLFRELCDRVDFLLSFPPLLNKPVARWVVSRMMAKIKTVA